MTEEGTIEVTAEVIEPTDALEVTYTPAVFSDNLAALDAYVDQQIEPYIGAQLDPNDYETIKMGRTCMADLNKLKAPIEAERKRVKKIYEAPLKEFEARVKAITAKIDSARANIKEQVDKLKAPIEAERKRVKKIYEAPLKEFEARVKAITAKIDSARANIKEQVDEADANFKAQRRETLAEEYAGCAGPIADVIPFAAILEDKWLNRSTNEVKAVNELYEKVEKALKGYSTLQTKELTRPQGRGGQALRRHPRPHRRP